MNALILALLLQAPTPPDGVRLAGQPARMVAESAYQVHGTPYLYSWLHVDPKALQGMDLHRALALVREGKVAFQIDHRALVAVSGARRRHFNELGLRQIWPDGLPKALVPEAEAYLEWTSRSLEQGDAWAFRFEPGKGVKVRFGAESWRPLGGPGMIRILAMAYFESGAAGHGPNEDFREGLRKLLAPAE